MAPATITQDYYKILEVEHTAATITITKSYRRLAIKIHPDRNTKPDATAAFQLLGEAYATLKDESARRAYDLIYPTIVGSRPSQQWTQASQPSPQSPPQSAPMGEAAEIAIILKSMQERNVQWQMKKNALDWSILQYKQAMRRLEQDIDILNSIAAAEATEEAQKNSWTTWMFSPFYKSKPDDTEAEKDRKDRARQERRIEKDMKERRLRSEEAKVSEVESQLKKAKAEVDAADSKANARIIVVQANVRFKEMCAREKQERQQREERVREQRENLARAAKQERQQREERAQEQRENLARAAKQEEEMRRWAEEATNRRYQAYTGHGRHTKTKSSSENTHACSHNRWWTKVQGRTECPKCDDFWTYLLQCPDCKMEACPKCQRELKSRSRYR